MRVAVYANDIPNGEDIPSQNEALMRHANYMGYRVVRSFSDVDIWTKSASGIYGINQMLELAKSKSIELVLVKDLAYFASGLSHFLSVVNELHRHGVGVYFHNQKISTFGPEGEMVMKVIQYLKEHETRQASFRITAGMLKAQCSGKTLGRPRVECKQTIAMILALRSRDMGVSAISKVSGLGVSTIYRILKEAEQSTCA